MLNKSKLHVLSTSMIQANQVLPEQRYWLRVQISLFTDSDLHPYLGCESCGTRCEFPKRTIFNCVSCRKEDAISGPRFGVHVLCFVIVLKK